MSNTKKAIPPVETLIAANSQAEMTPQGIEQYPSAETIFAGESPTIARNRARLQRDTGDVSARFQSIAQRELSATSPEIKKSLGEEKQKLLREKMRLTRLGAMQIKGSPEEQKILEKREGFNALKASDILYLKQKGSDLAPLLLADTLNPLAVVRSEGLKIGQNLTVNYGENKALHNSIGLGDILPLSVTRVRINGVEAVRMSLPRPGYYVPESGKKGRPLYSPVYDGYSVEILEIGSPSTAEIDAEKKSSDRQFRRMRINDMVAAMTLRGDNWKDEFTSLPEDMDMIEEAKIEKTNRASERTYLEGVYSKANGRENFIAYFANDINRITNEYGINPNFLIKLIEKEGSWFNPFTKTPKGSAVGLGQITDQTWQELQDKIIPSDGRAQKLLGGANLERYNPLHQLVGMCAYLNAMKVRKQAQSWSEAVVYYHTGPGATDADVEGYLVANPAIAWHMPTGTRNLAAYVQAAIKYYDLSGVDTTWTGLPPSTKTLDWDGFTGAPARIEVREDGKKMTYCSYTTWLNGTLFGVNLPRGSSANESQSLYDTAGFKSLDSLGSWDNIADVFLSSSTENGKKYGHRALAIKSKNDGAWYILDPYWGAQKPMLASEYLKKYANNGSITHVYGHRSASMLSSILA
jgi:hypothetical protein